MRSIKKNYIYNLFYQILSMIVPLITTPYLSRILGSEKIGVYSYNYSIVHYFTLFVMLGLNNYGNRTIASSRNDRKSLSKNFSNIYTFQLLCGLGVSVVYFGYIFLASANKTISIIFYLYLLGAIFDVNWFFFGMEEFKLTVIRNTLVKILSTVSIFIFVRNSNDINKYCCIFSLSFLISQLCLWPFVRNDIDFVKPEWKEIRKHIKPNLILFVTVLLVSLFKIMDKIMLGMISNYDEVGYYESSEKIIAIPIALITALGTVMLPRTTNLMANGKDNEAKKYINISIMFAMFISSSMCFGIMGLSNEFVPLFYGKGFEKCIYLFLTLLPSCLFLAFANVIRTQYLLPKKMDRSYIISAGLGAVTNIIINLLLIRPFGALGAGIGTFCAELAVCVYQVYSIKNYLPVGSYIKSTLPFLISGIVMFSVLFFVGLPVQNRLICMTVKIFLGIIIYISALLLSSLLYKKIFHKRLTDYSCIKNLKK